MERPAQDATESTDHEGLELVSLAEAGRKIGVSRWTMHRMASAGLRTIRMTPRGIRRTTLSWVLDYIEKINGELATHRAPSAASDTEMERRLQEIGL